MITMEALHAGKGMIAENRDSIPIQEVPMQDHHLAVVEEEEEAKAIVKAIADVVAIAITVAITIAIAIAIAIAISVSVSVSVAVAVAVADAASPLSTSGPRHTSPVLFLLFFCFLIVDCRFLVSISTAYMGHFLGHHSSCRRSSGGGGGGGGGGAILLLLLPCPPCWHCTSPFRCPRSTRNR